MVNKPTLENLLKAKNLLNAAPIPEENRYLITPDGRHFKTILERGKWVVVECTKEVEIAD